jgi:hypothetical protein
MSVKPYQPAPLLNGGDFFDLLRSSREVAEQ